MKPFTNPYLKDIPAFNGPGKNLYRAPASIDINDYEFIKSLRPNTGTIITTQNILWFKLCQALKSYGITDFTHRTDFEQFVANCNITDGRGTTVGGDAPQDDVGNVRRGTESPRSESTDASVVKPIAPRRTGKEAHQGGRKGRVKN